MLIRQAQNSDLQVIIELLIAVHLPTSDCAEHINNFWVSEENMKVIGVGGLQVCGDYGLIRSIVVSQKYQKLGVANAIYLMIERNAISLGLKSLFLLTNTASDYFKNLGFTLQNRSKVPSPILETKQFSELCPSSATPMIKVL